jgi:hypothetical protein
MMSRLVVVLAVTLFVSYAEAASKCAKPAAKSTSQLTLHPPQASSSGQFSFPQNSNGNCNSGPNGNGNAGNCNGNGNGNVPTAANPVTLACNCTKGQAVYNIIGTTNASVTGVPHVLVACNNTKLLCMKGTNGKKYKLKKAEGLASPHIKIISYVNSKGKAKNMAILNCGGNSSSSIPFNKKSGLSKKKWNCKKQHGGKGTKAAPEFGTKKGKKYLKVRAVSCSGCKQLKTCKTA